MESSTKDMLYPADVDNLYHFNGFQCVQNTTRAEL
jgi:hypothetical protein